jgi:four helix bundle protein
MYTTSNIIKSQLIQQRPLLSHYRLLEQIEASSTSIGMNLAEGKGRFSQKKFV